MEIAYLIAAHTDPDQLNRLVDALDNGKNDFYIHIDKKSSLEQFKNAIINKPHVYFLKRRVAVYWGGFSQVEAISLLLGEALQKQYDRIVYISGLDYPILSNDDIEVFWIENSTLEVCGAYNVTTSSEKLAKMKIDRYHFNDVRIKNEWLFNHVRNMLNQFLGCFHKKEKLEINGRIWDVWWGSSWWGLTYECAKYVYMTWTQNKKLRKYFRFTFPPDEMWVQTILANSKYKDSLIISDQYDFIQVTPLEKVEYIHSIRIWEIEDYDEVMNSGKMFVRKLTSDKSIQLINKIKKEREKRAEADESRV